MHYRHAFAALLAIALPLNAYAADPAFVAKVPVQHITPGIEVLLSDSLHLIKGKRVGLLTNHSGRDR